MHATLTKARVKLNATDVLRARRASKHKWRRPMPRRSSSGRSAGRPLLSLPYCGRLGRPLCTLRAASAGWGVLPSNALRVALEPGSEEVDAPLNRHGARSHARGDRRKMQGCSAGLSTLVVGSPWLLLRLTARRRLLVRGACGALCCLELRCGLRAGLKGGTRGRLQITATWGACART
jgi:hypothetical protein